ncbi:MAG: ABC transporter permease [Eubacteriales bacterium]|nr:ABC transporter permease [Eubacteriales bacterium]
MGKNKKKELDHDVRMFKKYKNLLKELTMKNVKLKYRNSWLGILWSFIQPLLNMIVLSVVFGGIFGRHNKYIVCYPVFIFTGRLLFSFFTSSTKQAMTSFRRNAGILKKVYVPKYMYPLSSIFSNFVTFAISILCLICVWIFFKVTGLQGGSGLTITPYALLCFVPMFLLLVFSTGVGLILSVIAVYFRDVEYIWDVFCTLLFYMVPIIYPLQKITTDWTIALIKINPLYSMIELFRQCVLYGQIMSPRMLLYAAVVSVATLIIGIIFFNWKSDDIIFHL